jgi:PPOX class probable F420-dependent enzyme
VDDDEAMARAASARVGRMATVDASGRPHVVPVVFALDGRTLYWVVDRKPKRSSALKRLDNLRANPAVQIVVDRYDEDWTALWWVRLSGDARILTGGPERAKALGRLAEKYGQYRRELPDGPVVAVDLTAVTHWEPARAQRETPPGSR